MAARWVVMSATALSVGGSLGGLLVTGCGDAPGGSRRDAGVVPQPPLDAAPAADAAPADLAVHYVDPDHGGFPGGTRVLVRGDGFDDTARVFVGGRAVASGDIEVIDSRRIEIRTPPGEPGLADVEVDQSSRLARHAGGFRYEAITVDPPDGSIAGGTFVTITGLGTDFGPDTTVTFDGVPAVGLTVVTRQRVTGYTPPGTAGSAHIRVQSPSTSYEARRGFTYRALGDTDGGGMSGGPIAGTVNVAVIDEVTENGIEGAYVVLGDPATSAFQGFADDLGQITFSDPSIVGPVTVTAAAPGYEATSFVGYDARDLSVYLHRPPQPGDPPQTLPPQVGHIYGHVFFGNATGVGSPYWSLVPEPRTATEVKRLYVTTAAASPFSTVFTPTRYIDYEYHPDVVAWEFDAWARPSATAIVAIAGLYDPAADPSGQGVTGFEPFAMGVTRGVLVGPGETVTGVDVVVDIPLDAALAVQLDEPPALDTPGWSGPSYYRIRPFIDLGGEGVIHMNKNGLPTPPPPEDRPNYYRFAPGSDATVLSGMAPLTGLLGDASYGFVVGAYTETGANPYSVRVVRGIHDISLPIHLGDFLATPRPVDPAPGGVASRLGLQFAPEGPAAGAATFHRHDLVSMDGDRLLRIFTRGDSFEVDIPDLTPGGLPAFPTGQDVSWTTWRVTVAGATFDDFTFRHLSVYYWDAYAADAYWVQFPTQ